MPKTVRLAQNLDLFTASKLTFGRPFYDLLHFCFIAFLEFSFYVTKFAFTPLLQEPIAEDDRIPELEKIADRGLENEKRRSIKRSAEENIPVRNKVVLEIQKNIFKNSLIILLIQKFSDDHLGNNSQQWGQ